jgi:hypothetical protein
MAAGLALTVPGSAEAKLRFRSRFADLAERLDGGVSGAGARGGLLR